MAKNSNTKTNLSICFSLSRLPSHLSWPHVRRQICDCTYEWRATSSWAHTSEIQKSGVSDWIS